MKLTFFALFIFVLFVPLSLLAQGSPSAQQQFDSLYLLGNRLPETIAAGSRLIASMDQKQPLDSALFQKNLIKTSVCMYNMGRIDSSRILAQRAYSVARENSDEQLHSLNVLGTLSIAQSDFAKGDSMFEVALERRAKYLGTKGTRYFSTLFGLASSKVAQGNFVEAEKWYRQGITMWQEQGRDESALLGSYYSQLGFVKMSTGQPAQAEKWMRRSIQISEKQGPGARPAYMEYSYLAQLLTEQSRTREAQQALEKVSNDLKAYSMDQTVAFAQNLKQKGMVYAYLLLWDEAIEKFEQSIELCRQIKASNQIFAVENGRYLAHAWREKGEVQKAIQILDEYRDSVRVFGYEQTQVNVFLLEESAVCAEETGNFDAAIAFFQQGLHISAQLYEPTDSLITNNLGLQIGLAGTYLKARNHQAASQILQPVCTALAAQYPSHPLRKRALQLLAEAQIAAGESHSAFISLQQLQFLYTQGSLEDLFLLTDDQRLKKSDEARTFSGFILSFLSKQGAALPELGALSMDVQLYTKSLLLSAAQKIRQNIQNDSLLTPVFADWKETREYLAWSYTQPKSNLEAQKISISTLEARADSLEKRMAQGSSNFAAENLRKPFAWTDVRDQLRPGQVALEIARFNEYNLEQTDTIRYAVFIIRPDMRERPAVVFLPDAERLDQVMLEKYLAECALPSGKGQTGQLYQAFWKKLEPYLKGVSWIYVAADGAFLKINLSAIQLPDGQYVADRYDIRSVFSLKDVASKIDGQAVRSITEKTAFLAGNPTFLLQSAGNSAVTKSTLRTVSEMPDSAQNISSLGGIFRNADDVRGIHLTALPGSEKEVLDLDALLRKNGWKTTVALGPAAKENTVKALQNPGILHLATHGYFLANVRSGTAGLSRSVLENNPMLRSMIFFAGAQNTLDHKPLGDEDGILTAYEAQNLRLEGTELVVLSACQTAQGKIQNGEGVYGLQRALRIAGAQAVLLSLWDVNDKVGREFMVAFYKNWLGGMNKPDAFRAAQLAIKKKRPQPFYWAGFILIGGE